MCNLFTFIFIFFTIQQNLAQKPECKNLGEYCINHWDCCSNSCLSYLYKCVGSNPDMIQSSLSSSQNLISESVNINFSDIANNLNNTSLDALVSNVFSGKIPSDKENQNPIITNIRFDGNSDDVVNSSVKQNSNSTSDNDNNNAGTVTPCLEIGEKCTRNDQCCTERCHGFLHQCVT